MLHEMMQYTIRRTDAGKFVTVRDIAKRFQVGTAETIEMLTGETPGYAVTFSDGEVKGTTVVTVEDIFADEGSPLSVSQAEVESDRDVPFISHGTYSDEPVAEPVVETEAVTEPTETVIEEYADLDAQIEAHIEPEKASRKVDASYTRFATKEEAEAALGYKLVSVPDLGKAARSRGVKINRVVKAFGGDRGLLEPRSAEWKPVLVGRSRFVAWTCLEDLDNL